MVLNAPYIMRFMSNGIDFSLNPAFILGSFITFAFTAFWCFLDLYTIHEKTTVSPFLALIPFGNGRQPGIPFKSSPTHSKYSNAPYFIHTFAPIFAIFL